MAEDFLKCTQDWETSRIGMFLYYTDTHKILLFVFKFLTYLEKLLKLAPMSLLEFPIKW